MAHPGHAGGPRVVIAVHVDGNDTPTGETAVIAVHVDGNDSHASASTLAGHGFASSSPGRVAGAALVAAYESAVNETKRETVARRTR